MIDFWNSVILVGVAAIITFLLRAFPFIIFGGKKQMPEKVKRIADYLPVAIMAVLVIYCIKNEILGLWNYIISADFTGIKGFGAAMVGVISTAVMHLWKRKTLLSIVIGTAIYMILIRVL